MRGVISIRQVLMIQTMSEKSSALRATPERCQQCWFSIMRLKHRQDFPQHSFSFLKNTAANLKLCENLLTSTQQANLSLLSFNLYKTTSRLATELVQSLAIFAIKDNQLLACSNSHSAVLCQNFKNSRRSEWTSCPVLVDIRMTHRF